MLSTASIIVGVISGLIGSFAGLAGGARLVYWLIEHKLDGRYDQRYIPRQEVNVGIVGRITACESQIVENSSRILKLEKQQEALTQEVQHLTTHISEQILVALRDLTGEMREMRTEQSEYAVVQAQHAEMMKTHATALNSFQQLIVQAAGGRIPLFPVPSPGQ